MKKFFPPFLFLVLSLISVSAFSQQERDTSSLGMPGDNLDLYAVLDLFQKSKTIEAFEKSLNEQKAGINNLDLDLDKKVDFIKVVTKKKDSSYQFILQVHVSEKEIQDVAVILLDKDKKGKVTMQIVGDKALYGENYVVEPVTESVTANPGYKGADPVTVNVPASTTVVVESAPIVQYVYSPAYVPYYPPYYYGYYPPYFAAFTVMAVGIYRSNHYYHHGYGGGYYHNTTIIHNENNFNNYNGNRNNSDRVNHNSASGKYGNRNTNRGSGGASASTRPSGGASTRPGSGGASASTRPSTTPSRGSGGASASTRPSTSNNMSSYGSGGRTRSSGGYSGSSGMSRSGGGMSRGGGGGGGRRR